MRRFKFPFEEKYYVYRFQDLSKDFEDFQVGKGTGGRAMEHVPDALKGKNRHPFFYAKLRKMFRESNLPIVVIDFVTDDEGEAYGREIGLINQLGRRELGTGPLCNQTRGGEGFIGGIHYYSKETKAKLSRTAKANGFGSPKYQQMAVAANKGSKRTPRQIANLRRGQKGAPRPNYTPEKHTAARTKVWSNRSKQVRARITEPMQMAANSRSFEERSVSMLKAAASRKDVQKIREIAVEIYLTPGKGVDIARKFGVTVNSVSRI